jgi:hypothetical protein
MSSNQNQQVHKYSFVHFLVWFKLIVKEFCLQFRYTLNDFGENRFARSLRSVMSHCELRENWCTIDYTSAT